MQDWVLRMPLPATTAAKSELLLTREWLVTNGLGGYASGTIAGVASRRYHSLLIAALPAPLGRRVMLNHLSELLRLPDGSTVLFSTFLGGRSANSISGMTIDNSGNVYLVGIPGSADFPKLTPLPGSTLTGALKPSDGPIVTE